MKKGKVMRVLLIDVNCKEGSTGKILYSLYSYLNSYGDEAAICYGRGNRIQERNIYKFGLDWETYFHALMTRITGYTGCFSFFSTQKLIKYINKFNPDVVHIHELHAYFVNIKSLLVFLAKKKIKVIHTLHCEFSYTGKCGYSNECERWKTGCGECPHLKDYPSTIFFDHTRKMCNAKKKYFSMIESLIIATPSTWLSERARKSFFNNRKVVTINNGVDEEIFHYRDTKRLRRELAIPEDYKVILSVAPDIMSDRKGGKWLLEIAKKNKEKLFYLLIGGKPETGNNYMVLPETYDQVELSYYYSLADVFVICSKKETFSMTCAEALLCGTPIAGFKCGAPESVFIPPYAIFANYGNVKELETAIQTQLNCPEKNIDTYARKFTSMKMAENYRKLYQELM